MKDKKKIVCKHCSAINQHHSFQCTLVRKPIKVNIVTKEWKAKNDEIKASKPRAKINPKSDKQKKIDAAYSVLRCRYMKDHPRCMFKDCQAQSQECHHIRGRGKEYMLDTREWMAVCKMHHDWIHANDKESRELGYLKSRLGK